MVIWWRGLPWSHGLRKYGVSGVMTFIVNQNGTVYQKDLGPKTAEIAKAMTLYNPDRTWKRAH